MSAFRNLRTLLAIVSLLLWISPPALGALEGDCDNDGSVTSGDGIYILSYIFAAGAPPPNYDECDCDGFPGVNYGDMKHIEEFILHGTAPPYAGLATDLITVSDCQVMVSGKPDGVNVMETSIFMNNPYPLDGGMTLPFSFEPEAGNSDLRIASITLGPSFAAAVETRYNAYPWKFLLHDHAINGGIPQTNGWELLCTVAFEIDPGGTGAGTPVEVRPATYPTVFPLLITRPDYDGTNFARMEFPRFVRDAFAYVGDADCSGGISIGDAVYLINFIFAGGPPPGDTDNDGVPDCPGL